MLSLLSTSLQKKLCEIENDKMFLDIKVIFKNHFLIHGKMRLNLVFKILHNLACINIRY